MQHRNFQLFIAGQLISLIGTWMQNMAQLWLVYQLTHSAALLGVFGFASQVPMLFLSSLGGYVGDRFDRHRGVIVTQTITMLLAFVLAGLTWAHLIGKWNLIVIAFLVGIVNAFDVPIRQAFFVQMVGKEDLPNAIALNSSIFNAARAVGPAIAGFAIALVGAGGCFFLNGLSFVAVIVALLMMRIEPREIKPRDRKSTRLNSSHGYISYAVFCLKKKNRPTEVRYGCLQAGLLNLCSLFDHRPRRAILIHEDFAWHVVDEVSLPQLRLFEYLTPCP